MKITPGGHLNPSPMTADSNSVCPRSYDNPAFGQEAAHGRALGRCDSPKGGYRGQSPLRHPITLNRVNPLLTERTVASARPDGRPAAGLGR